jgi:thioredoxin-like negative regulator of GroEL
MQSNKFWENLKNNYFDESWCGPCKRLYPILTQKASSSEHKWNLLYVNIDEFPDLAETYQVIIK